MLEGNVLITGGTGFLGRGILREARDNNWPCNITVYSRDETKQDLCKRKYPGAKYVIGDILDYDGLRSALRYMNIGTVVHAAAIKYVPEAEYNVRECLRVNIHGTENVIQAVTNSGVQNAVLISTDKAVQPVNTYGASKMLCERMWVEAAYKGHTKFTFTRYGNVVGSTGSVIPLFQSQLREQGYVTITDPVMSRFWISIKDAVALVNHAYEVHNGVGVIPKAPAMLLGGVAQTLAGSNIKTVGVRPGEKLYEDLIHEQESLHVVSTSDENYWLTPPISMPLRTEAFSYNSNNPKHWLTASELLNMIEAARCV